MYQPSIRSIVAALSLACLPTVFARDAHAAPFRPTAVIAATHTNDYSWCLQYDGATDCAFSNRQQCAATASGSAGVCMHTATSAQLRD